MPVAVQIPPGLAEQAELGDTWVSWLDRLPGIVRDLLGEWELTRDGDDAWHGFCSLVLPVHTTSGRPAVLKVTYDGDEESEHEALALQRWAGNGTVRMLRADPRRRALLLERIHREDLRTVGDDAACEIVAGFYQRLHVPAPPQLRTVTSYVEGWLEDLAALRDPPIPRRYVEQTLSLGRDLVADPASAGVMVHGDLHHENVLAADREPWLVIDPKPMSGDPHYEPAPMLWNCWDRVVASGDVRGAVRRRFHILVDTAELDEGRARDWVVVRMVLNASWSVYDALRVGRALDAEDREWITQCIAIAKAVQD